MAGTLLLHSPAETSIRTILAAAGDLGSPRTGVSLRSGVLMLLRCARSQKSGKRPSVPIALCTSLSTTPAPRALGELGVCGSGAAVANAVFDAAGVRVRDFPFTIEKVLPGLPLVEV